MLIGLYLVASALYNVFGRGNSTGWVWNGVYIGLGVVLLLMSYSSPAPQPFIGGKRIRFY